jgi:hypothetical protein
MRIANGRHEINSFPMTGRGAHHGVINHSGAVAMSSINAFHSADRAAPSSARAATAGGFAALRKALTFLRGLARADASAPLDARLLQDIGESPASAEFAEALRAPFGSVGLRAGSGASRWPLSPLG